MNTGSSRGRRAFLAQHPQPMFTVDTTVFSDDGNVIEPQEPTVSPIRSWLGDEPTKYLAVYNREEAKSARQLFPEAKIFCNFDIYSK
jgi:hypothetical protein